MTVTADPGLLANYRCGDRWDELLAPDGSLRHHWAYVGVALDGLGPAELSQRQFEAERLLRDDGVSYNVHGDTSAPSREWSVDVVPHIIESAEWLGLEQGVAQRAELLDLVLGDIYGRRELIRRGVLPPELVYGHDGFLRPADGVRSSNGRSLTIYAVDLVRDRSGNHVVLADRTQAPSGAGYALENRVVVSRVLPSIHREAGVHRLAPYFRALRAALNDAAPAGIDEPRVVVLSPGRWNETYFEHALVARTLGATLVEGTDLVVRDGRLWLTSLGGPEPVDVVLRRVDDQFADPLELRPDSRIGVPGLLEAARRRTVTVVNPLGTGVLENPGLQAYLPALCRHLLGEELRLPSLPTWWCGDHDGLRRVLGAFESMVVKPISRDTGPSSIFVAQLSTAERDELRARIQAEPYRWVGQEATPVSTLPTLHHGQFEARPSVLRTFAVGRDDDYVVMAGGLTRVASHPDQLVISGQAGSVSKDTWVLASEPEQGDAFWLLEGPGVAAANPAGTMSARAAENLFWMGRYAERAEGTIRLVRCVLDRRNEFSGSADVAGTECVHGLLRALTHLTSTYPGFVGADAGELLESPEHELRALLLDHTRPGTLASDLASLLNAANAVRDQLSSDTWLVVSNLERELDQLAEGSGEPLAEAPLTLASILKSLLALAGLATESMVRDPGWQFLDAGRRVERSLQLLSLLRATVIASGSRATESLMLESVLTATESIITYRRRYRSRAQLETALDLLVLDETNPRSLVYQLDRLGEDLAEMPPAPASSRLPREQRLLLEATTTTRLLDNESLAVPGDGGIRFALDQVLAQLSDSVRATSEALDTNHFVRALPFEALGDLGSSTSESEPAT